MFGFSMRQEASSAISDFCQKYPAARVTWIKKEGDIFNIFLDIFPCIFRYFVHISTCMFQWKDWDCDVKIVTYVSASYLCGLMFGVLAGNLWQFEVRPNSQELDKLWSKIGELKPIALTSRKLRRDIAAIDFEAQTAIFDPIWSNGTPDFHHFP